MMVGAKNQDVLLETLEQLPHEQTIIDLLAKGKELQWEVNQLKEKLDYEKKANGVAVNKLNDSLDLICKIKGYI